MVINRFRAHWLLSESENCKVAKLWQITFAFCRFDSYCSYLYVSLAGAIVPYAKDSLFPTHPTPVEFFAWSVSVTWFWQKPVWFSWFHPFWFRFWISWKPNTLIVSQLQALFVTSYYYFTKMTVKFHIHLLKNVTGFSYKSLDSS